MKDLTVIFLTMNEVPEKWAEYHKEVLLDAINGLPLISISKIPLDFGINIIQDKPRSLSNIYFQLLRGCKLATTKYIAVAEDDILYNRHHFEWRPEDKTVGYNMSHWALFTWGVPLYNWRNRKVNYAMIGDRSYVIDALEERYSKYPNGTPDKFTGEIGRNMHENNLGVSCRKAVEFWTNLPIIQFNHSFGTCELQKKQHKSYGPMRAYDIPYWGPANELVKKFTNET